MANNYLVYSNARVKSMENTFLSNEKIVRMAYADTLEEGVKVLLESQYGGAMTVDTDDYEKLLQAEDKRVSEFILDAMSKNCGMETFLFKNDYHNLKALVKGKYMHADDVDYMLMPKGTYDTATLKEYVYGDDYSALSKTMQQALTDIDAARANGNTSPRFIDVTLEKACYKEIMDFLKKVKAPAILRYWQINIDLSNVSTFVRGEKTGNPDALKEGFIDGGLLGMSYFSGDVAQVVEKLRYSDYSKVADCLREGDMVSFERIWDNMLLDVFKEKRNDIFSISPIAGFYVAKKIEIKVVRMICIMLKNDVDKDVIKVRLRELYA